jgi:hypothetical protein
VDVERLAAAAIRIGPPPHGVVPQSMFEQKRIAALWLVLIRIANAICVNTVLHMTVDQAEEHRISNDTGTMLRLDCGAVVNIWDKGSLTSKAKTKQR